MKRLIFSSLLLMTFLSPILVTAQLAKNGYVIEKKENKIYLDLGNKLIKNGDRLKVIKEGGVFTHPVSGEKIKEEDEIISYIEITDAKENYSVASSVSKQSYDLIQVGMKVFLLNKDDINSPNLKKSIVVQPLTVTNVQGYLGMYISDVLTEQLLVSNRFKVLDRSTLGIKTEDLLLSSNGLVSESEFLKYPNASKADYYISGTMYEPDVVEVSSGIPVKNLVNLTGLAVGAITGRDMSKLSNLAEYMPDKMDYKNLRAIVKISLKIIDVKTGEILFICTDMQEANGKSEVNMEGGVLNGLKVNGGAATFGNTITGEATKICLENLLGFIFQYFDGKITTKNYIGNRIKLSKENFDISNKIQDNQFIIYPYKDEGHFRIGQIKKELENGEIIYEYFKNGRMTDFNLRTGMFLRMDNDKSYLKVNDVGSLNTGDTIFKLKAGSSVTFGHFLSWEGTSTTKSELKYEYQDDNGLTKISTTNLGEIYTIKKGIPISPYIHTIFPDSLYLFFYEKENRIVTAKAKSNLNSKLMSYIEFNNLHGDKILINCNNRYIYPLNEAFNKFKIRDAVYFNDNNDDIIEGKVVGYDPLDGTLKILQNKSLNCYDVYYGYVRKGSK